MADKRFPVLTVTGGSAAASVQMAMDGVPMRGVVKAVIRMEVGGAVHLYTKQIVELGSLSITMDPEAVEQEVVPDGG